ncbi:hypothetical protein HDU67_005141 [Dinochytrium kinnereticum]|nr:hypothetical protein HDU67_005141 [Dinochytrium kinnereticum]
MKLLHIILLAAAGCLASADPNFPKDRVDFLQPQRSFSNFGPEDDVSIFADSDSYLESLAEPEAAREREWSDLTENNYMDDSQASRYNPEDLMGGWEPRMEGSDFLSDDFPAPSRASNSDGPNPWFSSESKSINGDRAVRDDWKDARPNLLAPTKDDIFGTVDEKRNDAAEGSVDGAGAAGFSEFHPPRTPIRAVDVRTGRLPEENEFVGVAPAKFVGNRIQRPAAGSRLKAADVDSPSPTTTENLRSTTVASTATGTAEALVPAIPEFLKTSTVAVPGLTNCQTNLMLKLAAFYETGNSDLFYGRCGPMDRHHGYAAGYVDLTTNQGSVLRTIKTYVASLPEGTENPFQEWMELLQDTASGFANPDDIVYFEGFCDAWRETSKEKTFREAFDTTLKDLYITPTLDAARSLHLTQPLSITILFDSMLHLGPKVLDSQIIPNITRETTVAKDGEATFISRLILLRQQYRIKASKAMQEAMDNEDGEADWDTSPDGKWEAGLAAYASLIVANGKTKEGVALSLSMNNTVLRVAGDVNGTSKVSISCDKVDAVTLRMAGMDRAAAKDGFLSSENFNFADPKPIGSWQRGGKTNSAGQLGEMGLRCKVAAGFWIMPKANETKELSAAETTRNHEKTADPQSTKTFLSGE